MNITGIRLIKLREDNQLLQREMAEKLGVSVSAISRYEKGEMRPNLDVMLKIKEVFGVSLDWIAGLDADENQEYNMVIQECKNSGISPEKLHDIINILKKQ